MTIAVGDTLPAAEMQRKTDAGIEKVTTDDLFAGKKVALFALPGAFTPTCSAKHLPGFMDKADELKAKGIDAIVCLSVNDAHVMKAWADDQKVGDVIDLIADGSLNFTNAVGLVNDASAFGMGLRSKRYSMIVEDGVVRTLNVEAPGGFDVSTAEAMLEQL